MVTAWPKNFPGLGDAAEDTATLISEMSGGAIEVKVYAANEFVGPLAGFDAVASGSADFYHAADYYWTSKSRAYPFFAAIPFGMTAVEHLSWLDAAGGQELWDELAARFNIKPLPAGNTGHQMGGWFKREVQTLDDLVGLKIRMPGLGGEVLRRAGAAAVSIPGNELYQALQSGSIDATEWVGPWNDIAFGLYREASFYYWPGFHEPSTQLSLGVNLDLWNEFTPYERSIVQNAARSANQFSLSNFTVKNAQALKRLKDEHNVQLRRFPDEILEVLYSHTQDVLGEIGSADEFSRTVLDSYFSHLSNVSELSRITDEAYLMSRRSLASG